MTYSISFHNSSLQLSSNPIYRIYAINKFNNLFFLFLFYLLSLLHHFLYLSFLSICFIPSTNCPCFLLFSLCLLHTTNIHILPSQNFANSLLLAINVTTIHVPTLIFNLYCVIKHEYNAKQKQPL